MINKFALPHYTRGRGLHVNVDPERGKPYPHFIGVDFDQLQLFGDAVFDFIYTDDNDLSGSFSQLEESARVIKTGGHLISASAIYQKLDPPYCLKTVDIEHKPSKKTAAVVRYGGFGDMLQTSSILPGLKRQGFHITMFTHTKAKDIVVNDPHIDDYFLVDKEQVPNEWLGDFWDYHRPRFDRFINLSESVEGSLLALEYRINYHWPKEARHKFMNHNYVQMSHWIAGVPFTKPETRFYPDDEEVKWAEDLKAQLQADPLIMWVVSGSSVHKVWPYMDNAIARILVTYPNAKVILAGDPDISAMGEIGWENEPRVICTCKDWEIRQSLTMAEYCDLVIGPETGVLNSVSMRDIQKIMFMSHSSPMNNGHDWKNTTLLTPEDCGCYPCHQLHYRFDTCSRDEETGTAECQAKIDLEPFWRALIRRLKGFRKAA